MGCGFSGLPSPLPWSMITVGGPSTDPCLECGAPGTVAATLAVGGVEGALCGRCAAISGGGEVVQLLDGKKAGPRPLDFQLIAPDVWSLTAMHAPANMHMPGLFVPNRMFALRIKRPTSRPRSWPRTTRCTPTRRARCTPRCAASRSARGRPSATSS